MAADPIRRWLRSLTFRWRVLLRLVALAVPVAALAAFGMIWLTERGWILWFVIGWAALGFFLALPTLLPRRRPSEAERARRPRALVTADPEWTERETAAWDAACRTIRGRTERPLPWTEIPPLIEAVAEQIARDLGRTRGIYDFTVPELLLLVEQVAERYRATLLRSVPFVDRLTLSWVLWLHRHRDRLAAGLRLGGVGMRVARIAVNPPAGLMRELERMAAGEIGDYLSEQGIAVAQEVLLEEVAAAAVNLLSGRLKHSDAELLEVALAETGRDRAHLVDPDRPLRIVLAGQVSAGKSTLVDALLGRDASERDMAPTTDRPRIHEDVDVDGVPAMLVDLPGLDGTPARAAEVQTALAEADMVLWLARADRPARALDRAALAAWRAAAAPEAGARPAPLIVVASAVDRLDPGWPHPEHHLPEPVAARISAACAAIHDDLGEPAPIAVSAESPAWNVDTLEQVMAHAVPAALQAQRARIRRLAGAPKGFGSEALRGRQGLSAAGAALGRRIFRRYLSDRGKGGGGSDD